MVNAIIKLIIDKNKYVTKNIFKTKIFFYKYYYFQKTLFTVFMNSKYDVDVNFGVKITLLVHLL